MVWDTLFATDANFEIQPQMAESVAVSEDGKTYTIKLRSGLKRHDGSSVTPDDCIASIARWGKKDGMGQQMMAVVESMEAVDDLTFTIKLKETWGLVLAALGKMSSNVPRDEPASGAAGGKIVNFDRFEWHYFNDDQGKMNALINGEVDYWDNPPADLIPILREAEGVKVVLADPFGSQGWLRINHLHPPFDNKLARQAIQLVVDQETYLQAIVGTPDLYKVCPAMFMCDTPYGTDVGAERVMMQDIDKAKAMLAEAGYNGGTIVLMHPTDVPTLNAATQVTAQLLREAGINLAVQAMDWSTLTARRAEKKAPEEGGWHIFHTSWTWPDLVSPIANQGTSGGKERRGSDGRTTPRSRRSGRRSRVRRTPRSRSSSPLRCSSGRWIR